MSEPINQEPVANAPIYEPPCIERVLTSEDMEREVMFAGPAATVGDTPTPG